MMDDSYSLTHSARDPEWDPMMSLLGLTVECPAVTDLDVQWLRKKPRHYDLQ